MDSKYVYGGTSDYGAGRETNEDFLTFEVLNEDVLLAVIADGAGSKQSGFSIQPAVVAAVEAVETMRRLYNSNPEIILGYPIEALTEAMSVANRVIGAMKTSNEEAYSGFGVCMSCCLIVRDRFYFSHCGNTRVYLIRHLSDGAARIIQLTRDHTKAEDMIEEGTLAGEEYYAHPARYTYTSGLGFVVSPVIQTYEGALRSGDLLVLTTDGIHYAIRPEAISDIIIQSGDWSTATKALIEAAKMQKMQDNMSAAVIFVPIS